MYPPILESGAYTRRTLGLITYGQNRGGEQYVLDLEDVFTTYQTECQFPPVF